MPLAPFLKNKIKGEKKMSNTELTAKIKELKSLQAIIDEATAEAESIKDEIKAFMGDTEELRAGDYKVTYKTVTSQRFDSTAFKSAMPDVFSRFTKTTTCRRFTLA